MNLILPDLRVGDPTSHESVSVFPLFSDCVSDVQYRLSEEVANDKSLSITEISEAGSVPHLLVENKGEIRVLLLEGEELVGAKQNRVLNTSVLVAAGSQLKISVSCVEQRRWNYGSQDFCFSGSHSPPNLRRIIKASVSRSARERRGHTADQHAVWDQVAALDTAHGVHSSTAALSDVFASYEKRTAELRARLKYVPDATGMAVAVDQRIVTLDVFDKPATCQRAWHRLLSAAVLETLETAETHRHATVENVEELLRRGSDLSWEQADAIGEGEEFRAESRVGDHATALVLNAVVVHGSMITAL